MTHRSTPTIAIIESQQTLLDASEFWIQHKAPHVNVVVAACRWGQFMDSPSKNADIIVLDIDLPDKHQVMSKLITLSLFKSKVILTGHRPPMNVVRTALENGASGFVCKTEGMPAMVEAIDTVLAGEIYLSDESRAELDAPVHGNRPKLSAKQLEVMVEFSSGKTLKQIAAQMLVSEDTTKSHLRLVRSKCLDAGYDIGTKISTRQYALDAGYITAMAA